MASRARVEKEQYLLHAQGTAADISVRLFAFCNHRNGYQPTFSPEEPLIILKARAPPQQQQQQQQQHHQGWRTGGGGGSAGAPPPPPPPHPCLQWSPFADMVFDARPNTTAAVFLADATPFLAASPMSEREEAVNGLAAGQLLKRLGNLLVKLNPHQATLVASGASAFLALKYALAGERPLGHRDRYVGHAVLVCPPALAPLQALTDLKHRRDHHDRQQQQQQDNNDNDNIKKSGGGAAAERYPPPRVTVIVAGAESLPAWQAWLASCEANGVFAAGCAAFPSSSSSSTSSTGAANPLFSDILRAAGVTPDGSTADLQQRFESPQVFRVDFVLDRQAKAVTQVPVLSPLDTPGYDEPHDDEGEEDEDEESDYEDAEEGDGEEGERVGGGGGGRAHAHAHSHGHGGGRCCHGTAGAAAAAAAASGEDGDEWDDASDGHEDGGAANAKNAAGHTPTAAVGDTPKEEEEEEQEEEAGMLLSGLAGLEHWRSPARVVLECRVLDVAGGVVGTTDGRVRVRGLAELIAATPGLEARARRQRRNGLPVTLVGALVRDAAGRTALRAEEVAPMTAAEVAHSVMAGDGVDEIPAYDASAVRHRCGGLILRGRKCVLARELHGGGGGRARAQAQAAGGGTLFIPQRAHAEAGQSSVECAVAAVCDATQVSEDNFYVPSYLPPVVYYETDADGHAVCVTLYPMLSVCPPPGGPASDAREDAPEPAEPYDWVSLEAACHYLRAAPQQQEALRDMARHLARAAAAGLYTPFPGCGVFGQPVRGTERLFGTLTTDSADSADATAVAASSLSSNTNNNSNNNSNSNNNNISAVRHGATEHHNDDDCGCDHHAAASALHMTVVVAPGDAERRGLSLLRHEAAGGAEVFVYDTEADAAAPRRLLEAAEAAVQRCGGQLQVYLAPAEDLGEFCARHLPHLCEDCGAEVAVVVALLPAVAERLVTLPLGQKGGSGGGGGVSNADDADNDEEEWRRATLDALLDAVDGASALVVPCAAGTDPAHFSAPLRAALTLCAAVDPALSFFTVAADGSGSGIGIGGGARRRFDPAALPPPPAAATAAGAAHLRVLTLRAPRGRPLSPRRLAALAAPGGMAPLERPGAATLLSALGEVWVASRPRASVRVAYDGVARCLAVEEGEPWEADDSGPREPASELTLFLWVVPGAAEEQLAAAASAAFESLLWDDAREGFAWEEAAARLAKRHGGDGLPEW